MKDTIPHLYSQLASVEIHLRPFPHHGLSRDHVVRHRSGIRVWLAEHPLRIVWLPFTIAGEMLVCQNGTRNTLHADRGRVISLPRVRELLDPFGVRIWQWIYVAFISLFDTPGFDSMIATISWRQMHKIIMFCLNFARQLQTNHEQSCTQNWPKHPPVDQVEDKTKSWAGTYYWTGTKFQAARSKFWSAKSRVRLAGVTENAGRTCRKLRGIKRFFASRE